MGVPVLISRPVSACGLRGMPLCRAKEAIVAA
jgi:hypothetical protein